VQVEVAVGEFGQLADAAGDGQPRHRVAAQVLEHCAGEVAHVQQRVLGQPVQLGTTRSLVDPVQPATWVRPGRAGDVDAPADRVDPRRARVGTTTPVVPRIDSPPRMPSRGFHVLRASSAPFSTDTSTTTSPVPPCRWPPRRRARG
jgi:hypothetical protein